MTDRTEALLAWLDDLRAAEVDELCLREELQTEEKKQKISLQDSICGTLPRRETD